MRTKKSLNILVLFIISGLILSCLYVTEAFCVDWVLFSTFKNGNLLYYDRDSIDENATNSVLIRTKLEYSKKGLKEQRKNMVEAGISESEMAQRGHDSLHHTTILWGMSCNSKMSCMLNFTDYDRNEKILISHNVPEIESCDSITPKAPEIHSIFKMLCSSKERAAK
jgi:hypothetical protein